MASSGSAADRIGRPRLYVVKPGGAAPQPAAAGASAATVARLLELARGTGVEALLDALADFPRLVAAAPKGLFLVGPAQLDLRDDEGSGVQPLCFVDQTNHDMRIGWYTDTYRRTDAGWRLHTRSMTFLRRSGTRDSGKPHDPTRPTPSEG